MKPFKGFCVAKQDLKRWRWEERSAPDAAYLAEGQIAVEIDKFALTANNVTYARLGDRIGYWRFFPAPPDWGYIPVWGLGTVTASRSPQIGEGERVYGFFPTATHAVIEPTVPTGARFLDTLAHRRDLPQTYNEYVLVNRDPGYDGSRQDQHLVLRPLFSLSFFCSEWLKEQRFFGASRVLISSASSKTSLGLAFLLRRARLANLHIVGLTSPANLGFVADRGVYDDVIAYDALASLSGTPSVYVDVAGDAKVCAAVHHALQDHLKYSVRAGLTHWDAFEWAVGQLPGPAPQLFFTPDHILRLRKQWGREVLAERLAGAWGDFIDYVAPWLRFEHATGASAMEQVYADVLGGRTTPEKAHLLSIAAEDARV